jgi:hypothetical protein
MHVGFLCAVQTSAVQTRFLCAVQMQCSGFLFFVCSADAVQCRLVAKRTKAALESDYQKTGMLLALTCYLLYQCQVVV